MPRLSYFFGIAIYMYYRDHAPPHFHAIYGSQEAEIAVRSRRVLRGSCRGVRCGSFGSGLGSTKLT